MKMSLLIRKLINVHCFQGNVSAIILQLFVNTLSGHIWQSTIGLIANIVILLPFILLRICFATNIMDTQEKQTGSMLSVIDILNMSSTLGTKETYEFLKKNYMSEMKIVLKEKVLSCRYRTEYPAWKVAPYDSQRGGFSISLQFSHLGYKSNLSEDFASKYECPGNLASSGKIVWLVEKKLAVVEEWSCGSGGCEFSVGFYRMGNKEGILEKFCEY